MHYLFILTLCGRQYALLRCSHQAMGHQMWPYSHSGLLQPFTARLSLLRSVGHHWLATFTIYWNTQLATPGVYTVRHCPPQNSVVFIRKSAEFNSQLSFMHKSLTLELSPHSVSFSFTFHLSILKKEYVFS